MAPRKPGTVTPPAEYVVPPNTESAKLQAGIATTLRDVTVVIAFATAMLGFFSKRDLAGAMTYVQSTAALPAVALIVGVATSAWRFVRARRTVKVTALAADPRTNQLVDVKDS